MSVRERCPPVLTEWRTQCDNSEIKAESKQTSHFWKLSWTNVGVQGHAEVLSGRMDGGCERSSEVTLKGGPQPLGVTGGTAGRVAKRLGD